MAENLSVFLETALKLREMEKVARSARIACDVDLDIAKGLLESTKGVENAGGEFFGGRMVLEAFVEFREKIDAAIASWG